MFVQTTMFNIAFARPVRSVLPVRTATDTHNLQHRFCKTLRTGCTLDHQQCIERQRVMSDKMTSQPVPAKRFHDFTARSREDTAIRSIHIIWAIHAATYSTLQAYIFIHIQTTYSTLQDTLPHIQHLETRYIEETRSGHRNANRNPQ